MASALTPPPSMQESPNPGATPPQASAPTNPPAASPAPPKPSPQMQQDTQKAIEMVHWLRGLAQSYPAAAPHVQNINGEMRQIMRVVMEHQEAGEPAAPPVAA